jgi:hypothetical protein
MEGQIYLEYSYRMEGHVALGEVDTSFYKTLVGVEEVYMNPETGQPEIPLPNFEQVLAVVGKTLILSESIAGCIKAWLKNHRTNITISVFRGRKIEFEGPNLDRSVETITEMIDTLSAEENTSEFRISAVHMESKPELT